MRLISISYLRVCILLAIVVLLELQSNCGSAQFVGHSATGSIPTAAQTEKSERSQSRAISEQNPLNKRVAQQTHPVSSPPLSVDDKSKKEPKSADTSDYLGLRIATEAAFGVLGNGLIIGSIYAAVPTIGPHCRIEEGDDCGTQVGVMTGISLIFLAPALFTVPGGVYLGGEIIDGDGEYWPAFVGHLVGVGTGLITGLALSEPLASVKSGLFIAMALAAVCQVTGAIVGYELSLSDKPPTQREASDSHGRHTKIVPIAAITPRETLVGLSMTF